MLLRWQPKSASVTHSALTAEAVLFPRKMLRHDRNTAHPQTAGGLEWLCVLQGMHLVEGGAALRQLAERWKQKTRWAFTVLHSPVERAAKALALPALPGMSWSPHKQMLCEETQLWERNAAIRGSENVPICPSLLLRQKSLDEASAQV